jgi:hypothetical protein
MNSPLKENIDSFNNGYTYLRDNNRAVNRESVVVNDLPINKLRQLLTSNWTFVREQTLDLLLYNVMLTLEEHRYFCFAFKVDWILKLPCHQRLFISCGTRVKGNQNV